MTEINANNDPRTDVILDAFRKNLVSDIFGQTTLNEANLRNLGQVLNSYFNANTPDDRIQFGDSNVSRPRIVYGTVWLSADNVNKILVTSPNNPGRVLERFVFPTAVGENGGIVGEDPLTNIRINDEPIIDPETGTANFGDVVLQEFLARGEQLFWDTITPSADVGETDPVTGNPIEKLEQIDATQTGQKFGDLVDVVDTAKCGYEIPYYNGDTCRWETKHINNVLLDANPNLEDGV